MTLPGAPKSPKEAVWGFKPGLATQRRRKGKHVYQPRAKFEKLEEAQNDWSLEGKIQCWQISLESCVGTRWHQLPRLGEGPQTTIAKEDEALLTSHTGAGSSC